MFFILEIHRPQPIFVTIRPDCVFIGLGVISLGGFARSFDHIVNIKLAGAMASLGITPETYARFKEITEKESPHETIPE